MSAPHTLLALLASLALVALAARWACRR